MTTIYFRTLEDSFEKVSLFKLFPNVSLKVLSNVCEVIINDVPLITLPVHPTLELSSDLCDTVLSKIFEDDMLLGYWDEIRCLKQQKILEDVLGADDGQFSCDSDNDLKLLKLLDLISYCAINQVGLIWS